MWFGMEFGNKLGCVQGQNRFFSVTLLIWVKYPFFLVNPFYLVHTLFIWLKQKGRVQGSIAPFTTAESEGLFCKHFNSFVTVYCEVLHLLALSQVLEQDLNSLHVANFRAHIWMALQEHIAESKQTSSSDANNGVWENTACLNKIPLKRGDWEGCLMQSI